MSPDQKSRKQMLEEFVNLNPSDAFARYGLAMECARSGETEAAISHYRKLMEIHSEYVPGYQMLGQLFAQLGRKEEARAVFTSGIEAARKAGNAHAVSEMEGSIVDLGT